LAISAHSYSLLLYCSWFEGETGTVGILLLKGVSASLSFFLELAYGKMKNYCLFDFSLFELSNLRKFASVDLGADFGLESYFKILEAGDFTCL